LLLCEFIIHFFVGFRGMLEMWVVAVAVAEEV